LFEFIVAGPGAIPSEEIMRLEELSCMLASSQNGVHEPLKGGWGIAQTKGHKTYKME